MAATLAALGVAVLVGCSQGGQTQAGTLPGAIDQSASASDGGIVVEARLAQFSGTAVHVELLVTTQDSDRMPAGIRPGDAVLQGVPGVSGRVRGDGTTSISFPPSAWPEDATTLALTVRSVDFIDDAGELQPVRGTWDLTIEAPVGAEANEARAVEALEPVVVEIAGQDVVVMAFKTHDATIVHYVLPPGVESDSAPKLRAGDTPLEPLRREQRGRPGVTEVWYAPAGDEPLVLLFDSLSETLADANTWSVTIGLEVFDLPEPAGSEESRFSENEVGWEVRSRSGGPEVLDVLWRGFEDDIRLAITFDGSWRPGPTRPVVLGDGEPMRVSSAGTMGTHSDIVVRLDPSEPPPRELTIRSTYEVQPLPPVEVVLQP